MTTTTMTTTYAEQRSEMTPLPFWRALAHFLLAGIGLRVSIYRLLPLLLGRGFTPFEAFVIAFGLPLALLFVLSFVMVWHEGVPLTYKGLSKRLRLQRLTWRQWLWTLAGLIITFIACGLLAPVRNWVLGWAVFQPPVSFPAIINPLLQTGSFLSTTAAWMGLEAIGRYGYIGWILMLFFFNIIGEELYWRGVLLPRQELVYGRWTWLIHGILWNLFHLPIYPWYLIYGLALTLPISYIAQKTGNTWSTIIIHGVMNVLVFALMIGVVLGIA